MFHVVGEIRGEASEVGICEGLEVLFAFLVHPVVFKLLGVVRRRLSGERLDLVPSAVPIEQQPFPSLLERMPGIWLTLDFLFRRKTTYQKPCGCRPERAVGTCFFLSG